MALIEVRRSDFEAPVWARGYAYDLDGGSKPLKMNSHSRRVCVIISANKEFVIMKGVAKTILMVHLFILEYPRTGQNTRHKFIEVLFIAVCAVISGCELDRDRKLRPS